jgi:hypothetical protein
VIRQTISCDICGAEKKQTNHWFVAYDQGGELRVSGFNARIRLRTAMKHLCGQTCLHKLVDEFISRALAVRSQPDTVEEVQVETRIAPTDTSLTSSAAYAEAAPSLRPLTSPAPVPPKRPPLRAQPELVAMPARSQAVDPSLLPIEPPSFASHSWRADAWERERERQMRAVERHPDRAARRRVGS